MSKIHKSTGVKELCAIVSSALSKAGISAVLSGGAVVSIYSNNEYESYDLDFITAASQKEIESAMNKIGFKNTKNRYFKHKSTRFIVEFPSGPLAIGNEPVKKWKQLRTRRGVIQILTPTQCVMDRLAGYYFWNDLQNLDQAIMVANKQPIILSRVEKWSKAEGEMEKFKVFKGKL